MSATPREIILGIGGGIAAYKSCELLRRLKEQGHLVTVVPTPSSLNFVGAATWEALSGRPVTTSVFESVDQVRHISLARDAEAILIAPATADLIARIAAGRADDLLTNVLLASEAPIALVPAMHPAMWFNSATQTNVALLRSRGIHVMEPDEGPLTSGDHGKGRFPSTDAILKMVSDSLLIDQDLLNKRVLITAGGTREDIDPVRYIGNRSSGKQGIAIAKAALARGACVTLIAANVTEPIPEGVDLVRVSSADSLLKELKERFAQTDYLFMAAAVADARPAEVSQIKIKKADYKSIDLVENPDLLSEVTANKSHQVVVAFAAETSEDGHTLAQSKLAKKRADLIYLNSVEGGAIFGSDFTEGEIISADGQITHIENLSKIELAHQLINSAKSVANKLG